jgi:ketosteroid isomerase-like protein
MDISDADIAELAALLDQGRDAWINGRPQWEDPESPMSQADDATIFGPFGGVAPNGLPPRVRPDAQRQIASMFRGGSGSTEVLRTIVEGDLFVVLYVDRSTVEFGQGDEGPWTLRVTEVFRREPGQWVRLHRHADPLVRFRDLATTRKLMG